MVSNDVSSTSSIQYCTNYEIEERESGDGNTAKYHVYGSNPTCKSCAGYKESAKRGTAGVNVNKDLDEVAAQQLRDAFESAIVLNKDDPFEGVLVDIIRMNRKKRADYAADDDIFSNFRDTAVMLGLSGFSQRESALFNILQKIARLKSLRANGRMDNPNNESVVDTVLDLAVYSVIYLALNKEMQND